MISVLTYDKQVDEGNLIKASIKDVVARFSDELWNIYYIKTNKELQELVKQIQQIDIACYEIDNELSIKNLENMRKNFREMMVLVIAESTLSPMDYIKPSILASSLIIRPVTNEKIYIKIKELVEMFIDKKNINNNDTYVVDTREGKTYVPYNKIMYFEAKNKKIYVRMENEEIGFYETIENIMQNLPEEIFIRCHRSFIINRTKIHKVLSSKNTIIIDDNIIVPVSRSYKSKINNLIFLYNI